MSGPILRPLAEKKHLFNWNEKIEISGSFATTSIKWNGKSYMIRVRLP